MLADQSASDQEGHADWDRLNRDTDGLATEFVGRLVFGESSTGRKFPSLGKRDGRHHFTEDGPGSRANAGGDSLLASGKSAARLMLTTVAELREKDSDLTAELLAFVAASKIMISLWEEPASPPALERIADHVARESLREVSAAWAPNS